MYGNDEGIEIQLHFHELFLEYHFRNMQMALHGWNDVIFFQFKYCGNIHRDLHDKNRLKLFLVQ